MATCACEPSNVWLCCDATACSASGAAALNGNAMTEVVLTQGAAPAPSVRVRISHVAGRMPELCLGGDAPSCGSVLLSLVCVVPFIAPALCLLSTCLPVETVVELHARPGQAEGSVTRRSGCCTWCTPVHDVRAAVSAEVSDDEAPASVYLSHAAGAAKAELSDGFVPGLHGAINGWLRRRDAGEAGGDGLPA